MHENSVPARGFEPRRALLRKQFGAHRSPPKIMKIISASLNLFERRDAHIQAYAAVSEQANCSNSM